MVVALQVDTGAALDDLRDLARGIYPPLLADKGLVAALEAQARKSPIPVRVDADGVDRLPQDIEAAVYFSVLEGLQNVAKYAQATSATRVVRAIERGAAVPRARRRPGLRSLRDRIRHGTAGHRRPTRRARRSRGGRRARRGPARPSAAASRCRRHDHARSIAERSWPWFVLAAFIAIASRRDRARRRQRRVAGCAGPVHHRVLDVRGGRRADRQP